MRAALGYFFQRTNVKIYFFHFVFGGFNIKMSLQSKPEFRRVAKEKRKSESSINSNGALAFEYLTDSNGGNFDFPRQDSGSNSIRNEKFLTQNFAGMNRWNFFHNTYLDLLFSDSQQFPLALHFRYSNKNKFSIDRLRKYCIVLFYLRRVCVIDSREENLSPLHLWQHQSREVFDTLIFAKRQEIFWSKFYSIFSLFLYRRKIVSLSQSIETRYFCQAKKHNVLHHNQGEIK